MTFRPGYQGCRTKADNLPGLQNKLLQFLSPPAEGQGMGGLGGSSSLTYCSEVVGWKTLAGWAGVGSTPLHTTMYTGERW